MIAKLGCESNYTHYKKGGGVLTGQITPGDIGVAQISRPHHEKRAISLGLDLSDMWDNLTYARKLFEEQGDKPWLAPVDCSHVASI